MDHISFYKNFSMGTEIDIAGTFIYNGLRDFNKMKDFNSESEIFHVLYSISVGIERLQKVLIVLFEEIQDSQTEDFQKSLITHSHQDLHNRIKKNIVINFNSNQNSFLELLTKFYKTCRYDRFSLDSDYETEKKMLVDYISSKLNKEIIVNEMLFSTRNEIKIKKFIGRVVGSITETYYKAISNQARNLNLYTYEIRYESLAAKIFLQDFENNSLQNQYYNEEIAIKEFIIYLMNSKDISKTYEFFKNIKPLNLDIGLIQVYLSEICIGNVPRSLIDEVEFLYEENIENISERLEIINLFGNERFNIDEDEDDEEIY